MRVVGEKGEEGREGGKNCLVGYKTAGEIIKGLGIEI